MHPFEGSGPHITWQVIESQCEMLGQLWILSRSLGPIEFWDGFAHYSRLQGDVLQDLGVGREDED